MRNTAAVLILVALLFGGAVQLQRLREQWYPARQDSETTLYLTSPTALKRITTGYNALAADLYWMRTIQYYGDTKLRLARAAAAGEVPTDTVTSGYPHLSPLLELTTTLDPQFNLAYRFGSIFLAEPWPSGAGRPDLAIELLQKGLRGRPDKWEYMQDIGFVHYWWRHDYQEASRWFERAADVPGAPWFLRSLAATTLAEGGDRRSSRIMWESIRASAEIEWLKSDADRRLRQLDAMDFMAGLQRSIDQWVEASGTIPANWQTLVRARAIPGTPIDPTGTPYVLDAAGKVQLSSTSGLYPLPDEPQRMQ